MLRPPCSFPSSTTTSPSPFVIVHSSSLSFLKTKASTNPRSPLRSSSGQISLDRRPVHLFPCFAASDTRLQSEESTAVDGNGNVGSKREVGVEEREGGELSVGIGIPSFPSRGEEYSASLGDRAFLVFAFVACSTTIAFASLVAAAVPTLLAMRRTAISLAKLADTACDELPSTMAAIRLSGMELSDLTLELSDLSQEIADGVAKSAQAVQAAEAGIRQIGSLARQRTISMIDERANLPNIALQPVVSGAARRTYHAVSQARKSFMNIISRGKSDSESLVNRLEN